TLYGDGTAGQNGWGFTVNTVTYPGPTLYANQGDTVSLSLFSKDGMGHIFVVDWNSDGIKNGADVNSTQFSSTTTATAFSFTADQTGTHQYFCSLHGVGLQKGPLIVNASGGGARRARLDPLSFPGRGRFFGARGSRGRRLGDSRA